MGEETKKAPATCQCHGTGTVECPECHGKRHLTCPKCKGKKRFSNCNHCNSTGKVRCYKCHGKGIEKCPTCLGNGNLWKTRLVPCRECFGKGYRINTSGDQRRCATCGGSGQVKDRYKDICPKCNGSGWLETVKCSVCNGTGKEECSRCKGTGKAYCSDCDSDGEIKCPTCGAEGSVKCPECRAREEAKAKKERSIVEKKRKAREAQQAAWDRAHPKRSCKTYLWLAIPFGFFGIQYMYLRRWGLFALHFIGIALLAAVSMIPEAYSASRGLVETLGNMFPCGENVGSFVANLPKTIVTLSWFCSMLFVRYDEVGRIITGASYEVSIWRKLFGAILILGVVGSSLSIPSGVVAEQTTHVGQTIHANMAFLMVPFVIGGFVFCIKKWGWKWGLLASLGLLFVAAKIGSCIEEGLPQADDKESATRSSSHDDDAKNRKLKGLE